MPAGTGRNNCTAECPNYQMLDTAAGRTFDIFVSSNMQYWTLGILVLGHLTFCGPVLLSNVSSMLDGIWQSNYVAPILGNTRFDGRWLMIVVSQS
jgi:ABC-type spermidine/putrescine transport system permease subunit II